MKKKVTKIISPEEKERKEKRAKWLELFINFVGNVVAIVLGVVITFMIQGKMDRANELKEVHSALELVRTELTSNREDIVVMDEFLSQEKKAATYYLKNMKNLQKCPADSLNQYGGILLADVFITLPHNALEFLKMSSLFQKIGDNPLSMKIIRAYDSCDNTAANVTRHIAARDARYKGKIDTDYVHPLAIRSESDQFTDVTDIDAALEAIDAYLRKH